MGKNGRRLLTPLVQAAKRRILRIETSGVYKIEVGSSGGNMVGKSVVVTGATGAIGRAISVRLAAEGATIFALARESSRLESLVQEIEGLGGHIVPAMVDLRNAEDILAVCDRVGPVNVLINNAGGSARERSAPIWEQSAEVIDDVLSINLRATILCTTAFGRRMVESGSGERIINIGSTVASGGLQRLSEYAAAKAGVVGYTRSAALEFGPHGINVNCVTPGVVQRGRISFEQMEATLKQGVLPRIGRAEDISEMVAHLCGPRGSWVTGQEFVVDGGRSIGLHGER